LQDALRAGFVAAANDGFRFVHDRIQEAAYSLLPVASRPAMHLRIGRTLLARWSPDAVEERCFELVDHFNRAAALLPPSGAERERIGALNRDAGRKAKAAVAYAAARTYYAQARALQTADAWTRHYAETFALQLELAECEFLAGQLERADELFDEALAAAVGDLDRARVLGLRMRTRQSTGRLSDALGLGLQALALFGMHFPPTDEEAQRVFAQEQTHFWQQMGTRGIADLEHLPVATDPEAQAMMSLLADAAACAYNARPLLTPLLYGRALNLALQHGNSPSTCMTYISYGSFSVARGDIPAAFAFAELGLRLNERFGDARLRGTLLYVHGAHVNLWQRPLADSVPILEQGFAACQEVGNLVFAAFNAALLVSIVLESGEPLDEAGRIAHRYAGFAHEHRNEVIHPWMRIAEQLVANLQGRTRAPDSLEDDDFDEVRCLAAFARGNFHTGVANFHLTRSIACTFQRRGAAALAAAESCERVVRAVRSMPLEATHHFFHCLALCAAWPEADDAQRAAWRGLLATKLTQLEFWASHCPANYANRLALVRAEVARVEGRALDAMGHYDEAIRAAREHGFVQNEGLANQLAAEFHRRRGFDRIADAYLVDARYCYQRWGASALVAAIDQAHPALAVERRDAAQRAQTKVEHLDLMSVLKASQAVSDDIVLDRLVQTLLRIASEHAGADRGLLLLPAAGGQRIVARGVDRPEGMQVQLCDLPPSATDLPESVLGYVLRTREKVLLDATGASHAFADDPYFARQRPRSLLCLPLLKQSVLVGVLYLENQLIGGIFGARTQVLEMLASQAAISLENASLYANLQREQAAIRELNASLEQRVAERTLDLKLALREQQAILDNALTGIAFVRERRILRCNASFERLFGYAPGTLAGQSTRVLYETEAEFEAVEREIYPALRDNAGVFEDRELARRDGSRFWSTSHAKLVDPADPAQGLVWVLQDITARKQAEAALAEQSAAFECLARIDGLTGLFNRRHFDASARAAIAQCGERGEPVSAALLDLDHFKRINDHFSHATGDAVLKLAGELIQAQLEGTAIAGRYGGEEFAILFPGGDAAAAQAWCERLRRALEATDFAPLHADLRVTLSAGVAAPLGGAALERLLGEADRCLYQAKAEGRNRVCVAG
jgi:diguanylate cyclase (GGDEF)-like protein/PAS domain S-box-containing protein